jgi:hypothetical protein
MVSIPRKPDGCALSSDVSKYDGYSIPSRYIYAHDPVVPKYDDYTTFKHKPSMLEFRREVDSYYYFMPIFSGPYVLPKTQAVPPIRFPQRKPPCNNLGLQCKKRNFSKFRF